MNKRWPQQAVFAERVKEFCRKNGYLTPRGAVRMDVVADLFGLHEDTLRQFLQNKGRARPHIDTLTHIARVLGCRVTDFLDAPGDPVPGTRPEAWEKLSEQDRAHATAFFGDLAESDLTPAEKALLFGAYQDLKARIRGLRGSA